MPLYTTYLAFLRKADYNPLRVFPDDLQETIFYYVMRNRGNNEVAPTESTLFVYKEMVRRENPDAWKIYQQNYMHSLNSEKALKWMERVAEKAKRANVILICYEKDANYCHRKLLAEEIARRFNVKYKGELTEKLNH